MRAVRYHQYGDPQVLQVDEAAEPQPKPGEVRIAVRASGVNPMDIKLRAGYLAEFMPVDFPATIGTDAAGVVDEVGDGVEDVAPGDAVFGIGSATAADFAVLTAWASVPETWSMEQAAAAGIVSTTALACLDALGDITGEVIVIDGAAGGVGSAAAQIAIARGARVIGTASEANHGFLRSLGVTPTTYGPGLADRVEQLAVGTVFGAVDMVGAGSLPELVALVGDPARVLTINDPDPQSVGVRMIVNDGDLRGRLHETARLGREGAYTPHVEKTYPFDQATGAHETVQSGHARGKTVLTA